MKKLLALVLALVMTLGLATVSTSAAYTDANDIDYTEAVDVMTAVGVFQGKGDAFAPKDGLNRAEAAKLIAYLMLGNKTAEAMTGSGTRFTDVPASHWAAGFIEYLASVGVVSGVGNGQFNPNGQVTAVQFAKMLLVALGYDAELENFVGEGWSINIQKVANENDLFTSLDISANDALTREQAAQMCLNDLKADMVEYSDKGTTVKIGESTVVTGAKKAEDKTSKAAKATAIADEKDAGGNNTLQLGEELYSGDLKLDKSGRDDMGRPANQWKYKTADVGTYAAFGDMVFEAQDEVKATTLYNTLGKTVYDDMTDAKELVDYKVFVDGFELTDYIAATDLMKKDDSFAIGAAAKKTGNKDVADYGTRFTGNGSTTQIFLTEDGSKDKNGDKCDLYTFVITNEYLVQATADYSSSREEVNVKMVNEDTTAQPWYWDLSKAAKNTSDPVDYRSLKNTIKQEDFNVSDVKKDDYLVVTYSADKNSYQTVKPATMLEGEITKYVLDDTITIDGTVYKYAKKMNGTDKAQQFSVGNKAILVTDGKYILAVDDANATKDYVYLQDIGTNAGLKNNVKAALYGTDGGLRTVDVKEVTNKKESVNKITATTLNSTYTGNNAKEAALYGWYTYSVDDSGVYSLKALETGNTSYTYATRTYANNTTGKKIDGDKVNFLTDFASVTGNGKTVFILLDRDEDITIYNGLTEAPSVTFANDGTAGNAYVSYVLDGNYASYVFIDLSETTATSAVIDDTTLSDDYFMVVKTGNDNYDNKDSSNIYHPDTVLFEGEITTKNMKDSFDPVKGILYHKIKTNSKGYIENATAISAESTKDYAYDEAVNSAKYPVDYKDGTVTIGGKGYLVSGNNIYLILDAGSAPAKDKKLDYTEYLGIGGAALKSYLNTTGTYSYNYYGVRHDDNSSTLDALYVWVSGVTTTDKTTLNAEDLEPASPKSFVFTTNPVTMSANDTVGAKAKVDIAGALDLKGKTLTIDGGTVHVKSLTSSVTTGNITIKNGGKLYVAGNLQNVNTLEVKGCELTVEGTATITKLTVTGSTADPAVVTFDKTATITNVELNANSTTTFNGDATLTNVELKADSTTTFNGTATTVTNLTATNAAIVANKPVAVTNPSTVTGGSVTFASDAGFTGTGNVTYAGDVKVEKANAKTMKVNLGGLKGSFDVKKFSATGLTYTYEVGVDTIVLTFLADKGTVTYNGVSFESITKPTDKAATIEAKEGEAKALTINAAEYDGVTATVNLTPAEPQKDGQD